MHLQNNKDVVRLIILISLFNIYKIYIMSALVNETPIVNWKDSENTFTQISRQGVQASDAQPKYVRDTVTWKKLPGRE